MTEQEWLQTIEPKPMLEFLEGKGGKRKIRLFAVACCRRIPEAASYDPARQALEVAERYADGLAKWKELHEAGKAARKDARKDALCLRE